MRILLLAPHPFYIDRGTPIDVMLVLRVLSERPDTHVDVLVYAEGQDISLPNVTIHRIPSILGLSNVRPGFSLKKLGCDVFFFAHALKLVRSGNYDLIHAGEEAVFMALLFKQIFGVPYAYDIDSSVAQQMVEKNPSLKPLSTAFDKLEAAAIRRSLINFPVCNALGDLCEANGSRKTVVLHDISQLEDPDGGDPDRLRKETGARGTIFLYSGNLEAYQGIDLLLKSFEVAARRNPELSLVVVGGADADVRKYRVMADSLGILERTFFTGPRPVSELVDYLAGADVLVCPRIRGINTPMKVFPYLHSGKPVLVTDLSTHNQVLSDKEAYLAPATPEGFAEGMLELASDSALRTRLGRAGRSFAETNHTYDAHQRRLNDAYDWIEHQLGLAAGRASSTTPKAKYAV